MFQLRSVSRFAKVPSLAFSKRGWMIIPWGPSCSNTPHTPPKCVLLYCRYSEGQLMLVWCLFTWSSWSCRLFSFFFLKSLHDSSWVLAADGQRTGRDGPWCSVNGILPASCHQAALLFVLYSLKSLNTEVRCIIRISYFIIKTKDNQ